MAVHEICLQVLLVVALLLPDALAVSAPSAQVLQLIQLRFSNIIREHCQMQNKHGCFGLHYVLSFWMRTIT
uniref:Secreted protein n=1 Tax=Aegilops tauschii subsp. strangulata TaxID=200361 RepID=A0A453LJQ1_AEGTS